MSETVSAGWTCEGSLPCVLKIEVTQSLPSTLKSGNISLYMLLFIIVHLSFHLQHVILKVKTGLEGLVTMRAGKRPNVVVD